MEIKPPGSGRPYFDPSSESRPTTGVSKTGGEKSGFEAVHDKALGAAAGESAAAGGLSVTSQFSKADLKDPQKLEAMIQTSVKELIDTGLGGAVDLSTAQKAQIGDWMGSDPLLRRQIEKYLERVLP